MSQTVLLGDIAEINMGQSPKSEFYNQTGDGLPFMQGVRTFGDLYPRIDTWCTAPTKIADKGEVLLSVRAPVGDINYAPDKMCIGRGLASLKSRNNKFLYYLLSANKDRLISGQTGSVFGAVNGPMLRNFKINIPATEEEQDFIADTLGGLDEKIELNRWTNETLEQMGQTLFKHYFIINPEAKNWEESTVSAFAGHIKDGINPSKEAQRTFHQYSIPAFDNSMLTEKTYGLDIKSNKYLVSDGTILVSKLNPATPRIWPVLKAEENGICSTEFQVVKPKKYYGFIYYVLRSREFTEKMAMSAGGTSNSHRRVRPDDIFSYTFRRPPEDLLSKFEKETKGLLLKLDANRSEVQTLTTLRDTLLPRLISGKIAV